MIIMCLMLFILLIASAFTLNFIDGHLKTVRGAEKIVLSGAVRFFFVLGSVISSMTVWFGSFLVGAFIGMGLFGSIHHQDVDIITTTLWAILMVIFIGGGVLGNKLLNTGK